jgi:hypothetical protein
LMKQFHFPLHWVNPFICLSILLGFISISPVQAQAPSNGDGLIFDPLTGEDIPFHLTFDPSGGPVAGIIPAFTQSLFLDLGVGNYYDTTTTYQDCPITGSFEGGDGGAIEGTFDCTGNSDIIITTPVGTGNATGNNHLKGTLLGSLSADGTGEGTLVFTNVSTTDAFHMNGVDFPASTSPPSTETTTWSLNHSAEAFEAALATPTTAVTATQTPNPELTPTASPTADATLVAAFQQFITALQAYKDYVAEKVEQLQNGADSMAHIYNERVLLPFGDFRTGRLLLGEDGQPLVQDEFGSQIPMLSDGTPLGSTGEYSDQVQALLQSYDDIDWFTELTGYAEYAGELLEQMAQPDFEPTMGDAENPQLTPEFLEILAGLSEPSLTYLTGVSPDERQILQRQILALLTGDPLPHYSIPNPPDIDQRDVWFYTAQDLDDLVMKMQNSLRRDDLDPELRKEMEFFEQVLSEEPARDKVEIDMFSGEIDRLLWRQEGLDKTATQERWSVFGKLYQELGTQGITELEEDKRIDPETADYYRRHIENRWPIETEESRGLIDAYNSMLALRNQPKPPPEPTWWEELGLMFFDREVRKQQELNTSIFFAEGN